MRTALRGWWQSLAVYTDPRIRPMLFLGFAAGLPFPLVLTTLSARLRQAGIDRTTIGLFSLVGLAYSLKFFWSPIVDRVRLPLLHELGQRRSWILLAQIGVVAGIVAMALFDPASAANGMAMLATATAFCAATQDIAVDAYRIESVDETRQGAAAAAYQIGYQLALICAGAGALVSASGYGWTAAYLIMAACMLPGPIAIMLVREPARSVARAARADPILVQAAIARMRPAVMVAAIAITALIGIGLWLALDVARESTLVVKISFATILLIELALLSMLRVAALRTPLELLTGSVVLPLMDFFERHGASLAWPILALIVTYRLNYMTMGVAANTFYIDLGYTLEQIALVSKLYGVALTLMGAVFAGWLIRRSGVLPVMLIGLLLLSAANLFYGYIGELGAKPPDINWLAAAVSLDNVANGIAGTAFIAYMSSLTSVRYTATQYALFGTLWSLPAKTIASQWGRIVDAWDYPSFFVYTAAMGVPALLLIVWLMRRGTRTQPK